MEKIHGFFSPHVLGLTQLYTTFLEQYLFVGDILLESPNKVDDDF